MKAHTSVLVVVAFLVPLAACQNQTATPPAKSEAKAKGEAPTLRNVRDVAVSVRRAGGERDRPRQTAAGCGVNLKIGYIGGGSAGSFTSLHGPSEVKGDIAQLCAAKHAPTNTFR